MGGRFAFCLQVCRFLLLADNLARRADHLTIISFRGSQQHNQNYIFANSDDPALFPGSLE